MNTALSLQQTLLGVIIAGIKALIVAIITLHSKARLQQRECIHGDSETTKNFVLHLLKLCYKYHPDFILTVIHPTSSENTDI